MFILTFLLLFDLLSDLILLLELALLPYLLSGSLQFFSGQCYKGEQRREKSDSKQFAAGGERKGNVLMAEAERKSVRQGQIVEISRGEQTHMTLAESISSLINDVFIYLFLVVVFSLRRPLFLNKALSEFHLLFKLFQLMKFRIE